MWNLTKNKTKARIDGVICTKDRYSLLIKAVERLRNNVDPTNLYVYDQSDPQDLTVHWLLRDVFGAEIFDVRRLTFGGVRNLAMNNSQAEYVLIIDDDIEYGKDWIAKLMVRFADKSIAAVNGRLIVGRKGSVMWKITSASFRDSGGSGGACVYDRMKVLEVGNFDKGIRRGEDMELKLRLEANGYKWAREPSAVAFHPLDNIGSLFRKAKMTAVAWDYVMKESKHRTRFMIERIGSVLFTPFYYGWRTLDPRACALWFLFRFYGLLCFLAKNFEDWG